ncbi:J domain-containing protein [bacterium]|nr:J domain-containing protein [bacterium]
MTYKELQAALAVFGLRETATRAEIQDRHRELVKQHHPDAGAQEPEKMQKINTAYRILQEYTGAYRFAFSQEEFYRQNPEEMVRRQFGNDPLWGTGKSPKPK